MANALDRIAALGPQMRVVVLHGKEPFLLGEGLARYTQALTAAHGEIDQFTWDGETAQLSDVLDELRSYALFRRHKLVVLDHADLFLAGDQRRRRALEEYVQQPTEESSLLLRAETWRSGKLDKLVAGVGEMIRCDPLSDRDAARWCVEAGPARHDREVDPGAARLLVEQLGPGLARLDMELAKLAAFAEPGRPIRRADVGQLVGRSREEQAWALQTAIMTGAPAEACAKLRELRTVSRTEQVIVMWAITDLLRRLHTAAQLLRQGAGAQSLRGPLRLFRETGDRMLDTARRTDPKVFARLLDRAVQADLRTKTGLGNPDRNLEALTLLVTDTIGCT